MGAAPTIRAAIAAYLDTLEASPRTRATYRHGLDHFTAYLDSIGVDAARCGPDRIEVTHLAGFYAWLRRRGPQARPSATAADDVDAELRAARAADDGDGDAYSPRSLAVYTAAARSFITEQAIAGPAAHLDLDRMRRLLRRRVPRAEYPHVDPSDLIPEVVTYYDKQALPDIGAARLIVPRNRALLHTLDATGLRAAECVSLRRAQVADGQDEARVRGKGHKSRAVYFADDARTAIAAYLAVRRDDNPYLFISHGRGPAAGVPRRPAPLTTAQVYNIVRDAARAVGAPDVHPHTLRHHRASRWLTDGMPLEMVQELLGHASIVVTRTVYAHYLGSAVRDAYFAHATREHDATR